MVEHLDLSQAIARHARDGGVVALEGVTHPVPLVAGHEIIEPDPENREMTLVAIHTGVTVEEVKADTRWLLRVDPDIEKTEPPTDLEVRFCAISRVARDRVATERCDVLVVGGGITGCAAAWHLAGYRADVLLLEEFGLNTQASGRNAGSLHGQIQHASFLEFGEEWARGFLPALRFLSGSLEMWKDLSDVLTTDLEVSLNGGLLVAETSEQMRDIERKSPSADSPSTSHVKQT